MLLFGCSNPERRNADKILPPIPNEIFFSIFDYLAPPTELLPDSERQTFANLSLVCKSFANHCLPRAIECIQINLWIDQISSGAKLISHIAGKQPLALSLAKSVRECLAINGILSGNVLDARPTHKKFLSGISHMTNMRQLEFRSTTVNAPIEFWRVVASLRSLEKLSLHFCEFEDCQIDMDKIAPEMMVKVSCLEVMTRRDAMGFKPPFTFTFIHGPSLRVLILDTDGFDQVGWFGQASPTDFRIVTHPASMMMSWHQCIQMIHTDILERAPCSLETLLLQMKVYDWHMPPVFEGIFASPAWTRLPALRSFTLKFECIASDGPHPDDLVKALDGINSAKGLNSFVLDCFRYRLCVPDTVCSKIQRALHDQLDADSSLVCVDILGSATFRLVDGEWLVSKLD